MMEVQFNGKRAIVTGAGKGPNMTTAQIDLLDWDKTRQTVEEIGPVDLLVNNACRLKMDSFLDVRKEDIDTEMGINFNAVFNVSQFLRKKGIHLYFKMEVWFNEKRAIVTGAGKGIGRNIAKRLAQCGAIVFALSRTQSDLDSLKTEVPDITTVQIDLSDWDKTRQTVEEIGPVDLLVNNAGILRLAPVLEMSREDFDALMGVNFNAVFNVSQVVAKGMIERGQGGSIVNISSIAPQRTVPNSGNNVYSCSKAAVDMLTKCMAIELGSHNIRVNAVSPGMVWTDMSSRFWAIPENKKQYDKFLEEHPLGKFVDMDDLVNTVMFLLSNKGASIHGENLRIDCGYSIH